MAAFSIFAGLIILRSLLLSVGISDNLWVGGFIYGLTDFFAAPLKLVPGGDFELINRLTVADVTLLAVIIAFPFFLIARGRRD